MKVVKKFTFKTEKPMGRYSSFYNPQHIIKFEKKDVGYIRSKSKFDGGPFSVSLKVIKEDIMEDGNPNCKWRWISLKHESATLQEEKDWLNENREKIHIKWKFPEE